ncbi:MAG: hypothetical protein ABJG15_09660 [Hyphomonadaceae bacterium]
MRDLFQQDRAMTQSSVRISVQAMGGLFALCAGLIFVQAVLGIFGIAPSGGIGRLFAGLLQVGLGLGGLLALYMIVRLLNEILLAQHRLNDRLAILSDEIASVRNAEAKPSVPAKKRITKRASTKQAATKQTANTADTPAAKPAK